LGLSHMRQQWAVTDKMIGSIKDGQEPLQEIIGERGYPFRSR